MSDTARFESTSAPLQGDKPPRLARLAHSLRFKSTLAISIMLVLILGGNAIVRYFNHRDLDMQEAQNLVAQANSIVEATLWHAMLTDDLTEVTSIVENVGRQQDVRGVYLLDASGQIRFSRQDGDIDKIRAGTRSGLAPSAVSVSKSEIYAAGGEQVLRYTNRIENQPACYGCHTAEQSVLGYLVTDLALTEMNRQVASDLQMSIVSGIVTILFTIIAVNLVLGSFVLGKLEKFAPILRRFGQGDLSQRLPVRGQDEIEELATAFNHTAESLQSRERENTRLYEELVEKEAARANLLHKVIAAQEEERKRIARELHDDFSQSLTALSVTVQSAVETVPASMPSLQDRLRSMQELTTTTLGEAGRWIQDLRPRVLDELGLVPAIRWYTETRLESFGIRVRLTADLKERLPSEVEITLFRVIQEAISNIARHAQARNVQIRLDLYDRVVVAHIEDDGIGFVPAKFLHATDGLTGMGLLDMRERVALMGGSLTIDSTPGRGTRIRAEVPWKEMVQPFAS